MRQNYQLVTGSELNSVLECDGIATIGKLYELVAFVGAGIIIKSGYGNCLWLLNNDTDRRHVTEAIMISSA
jgi:hypothetical protein